MIVLKKWGKWVLKIIVTLFFLFIISITIIICNKKDMLKSTSNNVKNSYEVLVDVEESRLYLINNGKIEKTYKCSGGKWSTPSPIGTWKIIQKEKWGEGFGRTLDGIKCSMG